MIEGVDIIPLRRIQDERGMVMHMLREDDPHFAHFGEIYFSVVYPGIIKGWHQHSRMTINYAVVDGNIKLVLFDDRPASPTKGQLQEIVFGQINYQLVRVPPGVVNGFTAVGGVRAIVANRSLHADDSLRLEATTRIMPAHTHCRICKTRLPEPFFNLGDMPLANSFLSSRDESAG